MRGKSSQAQLLLILALLWPFAYAGDLAVLPTNADAFREKIGIFIRPGARAADARRLLESDRFHCQESKDADGPVLWCMRADGPPFPAVHRRYQVVIRSAGNAVTSVQTSTGLVGP